MWGGTETAFLPIGHVRGYKVKFSLITTL